MNDQQYLIIIGLMSYILGCLMTAFTILIYNSFIRKKYNLENLRDIILISNSNLRIIKKELNI